MDGELPVETVLNEEPVGEVLPDVEPTEDEVNKEPREPSVEPLIFYAARDYCRRKKRLDKVYEFADRLRAATKNLPFDEAKQRIWELCHPCKSDRGQEPSIPIPEPTYGPSDD